MNNCLYVVIPCHNCESVLPDIAKRMNEKMHALIREGKISPRSKVVFVNDGSKDQTWEIIKTFYEHSTLFSGINLSRSRGQQNALMVGLMTVKEHADMVISMDADLRDEINAIDRMIDRYLDGCDIVYGVRKKQADDTFLKRFTADGFYSFMSSMGVETVYNHADFRLLSRRALYALAEFKEANLFLRGIIPMIGFKSDIVAYEYKEHFDSARYPLKKKLALAIEGITSMSLKPIRMITGLGIGVFLISIIMLIYMIIRFLSGHNVDGWACLAVSVWAIGGLILLSVGIVGEYIGRIYLEAKGRPRYIVESFLNKKNEETKSSK